MTSAGSSSPLAVVRHVARTELRLQLRDGRVRVAAGLVAMLCAVSLLLGWRRHVEATHAIAAAQVETHEQFLNQGPKSPHAGAHFGIYAYRSESGLAFLDPGLDDVTGIAVFVEPHAPHIFSDPPIQDETSLARFSGWSGAGLAQVLLPLFLLLLAAPSIASERERGILRALLAQGVDPLLLLLGKALGIMATLAIALTPAVLGLLVAVVLAPAAVPLSGARAAWMALGYGLYLASFLFLALAVSARSRSVGAAVVVALGLWSFPVILAPRVAAELAGWLAPPPSAFALQTDLAHTTWANDVDAWDAHVAAITREQMTLHGVSREQDVPVNVVGLALQAQEDEDAPAYDRVYGGLFGTFARQEVFLEAASLLAPLLAVQSVSMAAAGTDMPHRVDYWWAVERYRRQMVAIVNDFITHQPRTAEGFAPTADHEIWDRIPRYTYVEPPAAWAIHLSIRSLGVLALWALASMGFAARSARRLALGA